MLYLDLCFVVKWLEDEDVLYDVLAAKDVIVEGQHVHEIEVGSKGQGKYSGNFYPIEIIAKGDSIYPCDLASAITPAF